MKPDSITKRNYSTLSKAFDRFNRELFEGALPKCLITFQRIRKTRGYFWQEAIRVRRGKTRLDEIALNPDCFPSRSDREVMSTLVHEMVHLWQAHFGEPGRRGYHNRPWADKMEQVGLRPSTTGKPGGHRTGERVSHYIIRGGRFDEVWGVLHREGVRLQWESTPRQRTDRDKVKYTCLGCKKKKRVQVWGKPGLEGRLECTECGEPLVEALPRYRMRYRH
jgi:predicted SprT family Zn-dependent metalloprotease